MASPMQVEMMKVRVGDAARVARVAIESLGGQLIQALGEIDEGGRSPSVALNLNGSCRVAMDAVAKWEKLHTALEFELLK